MPGFFCSKYSKGKNIELINYDDTICKKSEMICNDVIIKRNVLDKFANDKIFIENEELAIVTDGIVLNSDDLKKKYNSNDLSAIIALMAEQDKRFFCELSGHFSGLVYYKKENRIIAYTGPLGDHAVFYYYDNVKNIFAIGSQLNYIVDYLELMDIQITEDLHGVSSFLDYGYFLDDSTFMNEIKRLYPGDYLDIDLNLQKIKIANYYTIDVEEKDISVEDAIENLDIAFCNAITRLAKKNEEYGYRNLVDLSGGMDSRAIVYTVKRLGFDNTVLMTLGQSDCNDEKVAKKISQTLGLDWYYKTLDNGKCITQIEELLFMNSGTADYLGISGGKDFLETISNHHIGIEFTGLLGDVHENTMTLEDGDCKPYLSLDRYRTSRLRPLNENTFSNRINRFKNHEMFWFYTRGMMAGMNTFLTRQNFVEPATPFGDKEFIDALFAISWKERTTRKIVFRWMEEKYPDAIKLPYATTGISTKNDLAWYNVMKRRIKYYSKKALCDIKIKPVPNNMNPIDYWLKNNTNLSLFVNDYFQKNIKGISASDEVKNRIKDLFINANNFNDKRVALSAIAYYKLFFR